MLCVPRPQGRGASRILPLPFQNNGCGCNAASLQAGELIGEQLGKLWAGHEQAGHLDVDLDESATAQRFA